MSKVTITVRVDPSELDRIDDVARKISRESCGISISRAEVIRTVVSRGLDALNKELGAAV